ncbi:MAG: MerR family transcriptional regulator [Microbacterium arborescens]
MTTARLGALVGYSAQQIRDLERLGVLPPAVRAANGYRRYENEHLIAARTYRGLAIAIGPVPARRMMPVLVRASPGDAAGMIDDLHAGLALDRARVREALRGLETVLIEADEEFAEPDAMSVGELARALGIRPSALRHWEHERLVQPEQRPAAAPRRYARDAIGRARIVAALRTGGYPVPAIRDLLEGLRAGADPAQARGMLEGRLTDLTRRSMALLAASADLQAFVLARGDTTASGGVGATSAVGPADG